LKSMIAAFSFAISLVGASASAFTIEFDPCASYNVGSQKDARAYRECRDYYASKAGLAKTQTCEKSVVMTSAGVKTRLVCPSTGK
jgi:hypothetical protein